MTAGIRSGSSNDGYIQVNGNDIITALSGGNVGIGNTSPSTKLHVNGDITATNFIGNISGNPTFAGDLTIPQWIIHAGDTNTKIGFPAADTFTVETAGSEKFRITSTGTVGIGEDDPDGNYLLIRAASTVGTIKGHIMLTGDSATNGQGPQIVFSESGSGSSYAGAYVGHIREGSNSTGSLVFGTRATGGDANTVPTERLRIWSGGKVTVKSNATNSVAIALVDNDSTNEIWRVGQAADGDGYVEVLEDGGTVGCKLDASGNSFTMGNFGIGVASPGHPLHVRNTSAAIVQVEATNSNTSSIIQLLGKNSSGTVRTAKLAYDNADEVRLITPDAIPLCFLTQNGERLRIDANGKIGVGLAPNAWQSSTTSKVIQIGNSSVWDYNLQQFDLGQNFYYDGTDYHYIANGYATKIAQLKSDGNFVFYNAASGSSLGNVTWLEKLRIGNGYTGTVDIKGIPAHLRLYSQRSTSDWDANDPIGYLDFYVGDQTTGNTPYETASIRCNMDYDTNDLAQPGGSLRFYTRKPNDSSLRKEKLHISPDGKQVIHAHPISDTSNQYTKGVGYKWQASFNNPVKDCYILQDSGSENRNGYIKVTVTHLDYPGGNRGIGGQKIGFGSFKRKAGGVWYCWKSDMSWVTNSNQHGNLSSLGSLGWANALDGADTNILRYTSNRNTNYDTWWMEVEVWHSNGSNIGAYLPAEFYKYQ